jgi:hypothetical protein
LENHAVMSLSMCVMLARGAKATATITMAAESA